MRVWVHGQLKQRTFKTREGDKRTVIELDIDEIGPSLRFATASVRRSRRQEPHDEDANTGTQDVPTATG